ncbi:MAG: ketol-acid reductoisomerase, partial [Acidobacteriaceae bacterium]
EYGDYTAGPRIVTDETRAAMKKLLAEIQDGTFAKNWLKENATGRKWFEEQRRKEAQQSIEKTGAPLRAAMPFLDPVTVKDGAVEAAEKPVPATVGA